MLIVNSDLRFDLRVNFDLTGAASVDCQYVSPGGSGSVTPTIVHAAGGEVSVSFAAAENTVPGDLRLWFAIVSGGRNYRSSAANFRIYPEGS